MWVGWWWWQWGGFHSIMWSHQLHIGLKLGCDNSGSFISQKPRSKNSPHLSNPTHLFFHCQQVVYGQSSSFVTLQLFNGSGKILSLLYNSLEFVPLILLFFRNIFHYQLYHFIQLSLTIWEHGWPLCTVKMYTQI